ncbi:MAG: lysylphosphatidylglycerol synthase domain-containing protein [Candidatus Rehaiarchaeum fermentans]|nr:flippase-like domain-containing protein [Candidatus Rehaiarchaeum fermentans]
MKLDWIIIFVTFIFLFLFLAAFKINVAFSKFSFYLYYLPFLVIFGFLFDFLRYLPWRYVASRFKIKSSLNEFLTMLIFYGFQIVPLGIDSFLFINYSSTIKSIKRHSASIFTALIIPSFLSIVFLAILFSFIVEPTYTFYFLAILAIFYSAFSILGLKEIWNKLISFIDSLYNSKHFKNKKIINFIKNYLKDQKNLRNLLSQKKLLITIILYFPSLIIEGSLLFLSAKSFGINIGILTSLFIFFSSNTIGLLSFSPMGLGAMDIVSISLLEGILQIPGAEAVAIQVLFRIFNLVLPLIISYGALPIYKRSNTYKK